MGCIASFMIRQCPYLCLFASLLLCLLFSCGGKSTGFDDVPTGVTPIVSRVDPASGPAGTQVTIYGMGFSIAAPTNVVAMGDEGASADSYSILADPTAEEIETLTFTVPAGLAAGDYPVVVVVHGTASNSDVIFTVTP